MPTHDQQARLGITGEDQRVQVLFHAGISPATATAYKLGWNRYLDFCKAYQLVPLPLVEATLCCFVAHLTQLNIAFPSISSHLAACCYHHIAARFPDPSNISSPKLAFVLKGARWSLLLQQYFYQSCRRGIAVSGRLTGLCSGQPSALAFSVSYLRAGEFTCPSRQTFVTSSMLSVSDVVVDSL